VDLSIVLNHDGVTEETEFIRNSLYEFNGENVPIVFENINLLLKDDSGKIYGGILAYNYWNCMYIDILWIDKSQRDQGYGTKLMMDIEKIAREKGLSLIHLDTHAFQAPEFYRKCGYTEFGVLENSPQGYKRYYMKKELL
jgi:GNAT superfamily N-acetyltransferase